MNYPELDFIPEDGKDGKRLSAREMIFLRGLGQGEIIFYKPGEKWRQVTVITCEYIAMSNSYILNKHIDPIYITVAKLDKFLFPLRL